MADPKLFIPAPFGGRRGAAPSPSVPSSPSSPATQTIILPSLGPAIRERVLDAALRSEETRISTIFPWPTGGPLGIRIVNTLNQPVRVRVHVAHEANTALLLDPPPLEFDVGSGQTEQESLDSGAGDPWGPFAFVTVFALATPTNGSVGVEMSRRGDAYGGG